MHHPRSLPAQIIAALVAVILTPCEMPAAERGKPILYRKLPIPKTLLADGSPRFGGDLRIGDLTGNGRVDFVVFRSGAAGMKPRFLGAFTLDGKVLWQAGRAGRVPARPGPVAIHDIDGDGQSEVICFFLDPAKKADIHSMDDVVVQVRTGSTGRIERQAAPAAFRECRKGPSLSDWCHQRILVANFRGTKTPCDFVVKLGHRVLAFDQNLNILWSYTIRWTKYGEHTAYIPAVGDIDGDGKDEVTGGCYLLDDNGEPLWQAMLGRHMDSVAITRWDGGRPRVIGSGFGHVVAADGSVVLCLGPDVVPHGQEVRVADFVAQLPGPEMIIRCHGHRPDVVLVGNHGKVVRQFKLNDFPPKNVGMEPVYWNGPKEAALLYNGGKLWEATGRVFADLPEFPETKRWCFCIPANVCGDDREELVVYNPADRYVFIYTPSPLDEAAFERFQSGPRQYNARLMD